jgi:hypothetical protein
MFTVMLLTRDGDDYRFAGTEGNPKPTLYTTLAEAEKVKAEILADIYDQSGIEICAVVVVPLDYPRGRIED